MQIISRMSTFTLVMLISGAIDSIRNLPATALFGPSLIFFFIFSAVVFLIPTALVSAELSSRFPQEGGVYDWVRLAFGENVAFFAIWLQWINTMVWYPTILSFIAGTAAILIDPSLSSNKTYLVLVILSVFWVMTLINLQGLKISARFASICTVIGMIIPMALIILLAIIWVCSGQPLHVHISPHTVFPNLHHGENWISLTAIMAGFLGMELATVHVKNIKNADRIFPRAMLISVFIILFTMICGSLAIAFVLPQKDINLVDGVMQAFTNFFRVYHMSWMLPIITVMVLIGSLGGMVNWIISPAKGLLLAGQHGYIPKKLRRLNKHGVAQNLLITQAILVSIVCLAFLLMPSVNGSYWLLTDLSTELYTLMYIFMFIAAIVLAAKFYKKGDCFKIAKSKTTMILACVLGLLGCLVTMIVGFFPPGGIDVGGFWHYELTFIIGIVVILLPALGFYIYKAKTFVDGSS